MSEGTPAGAQNRETVIGPVSLVTPEGVRPEMAVVLSGGKILAAEKASRFSRGELTVEQPLYLSAGFIDLHVHGGGGGDFMDATPGAFKTALSAHLSHGTTTLSPTTLTATMEELAAVFQALEDFKKSPEAETLPETPGLHLEGPYVAPAMAGAQDPRYIRTPDDGSYRDILGMAKENLLIWTIAPELPGSGQMMEELQKRGVHMSVGHSEAQYCHVKKAAEYGCRMATHLYSSMSTLVRENGYRKLGIVESALLSDEMLVELIADGKHLPPELLRLVYKTKGPDKMLLVTDAMRGAGMPDGLYKLGSLSRGQEVMVSDGIARMPDGISFAGSVATADRLIRVMVKEAKIPLHEAVSMMTVNPARAVGLDRRKGLVSPGLDADLVLFDEDIRIHGVYLRGRRVR